VKPSLRFVLVFLFSVLIGFTALLSDADARRGGGGFRGGGFRGGSFARVHRGSFNRMRSARHFNRGGRVYRNSVVRRNVRRNVVRRNVVRRNVRRNWVVGRRYYGGIYYGHVRRFWRGRWWAYGVGSCWRLTPDGFYVWVCY
jgi:hypothetical protein